MSKMLTNENKVRVQFDMSKKSVERLDKIREKTSASSRAHVVRKALHLYEELLGLLDEGAKLYLEKNNKKFIILFTDLK